MKNLSQHINEALSDDELKKKQDKLRIAFWKKVPDQAYRTRGTYGADTTDANYLHLINIDDLLNDSILHGLKKLKLGFIKIGTYGTQGNYDSGYGGSRTSYSRRLHTKDNDTDYLNVQFSTNNRYSIGSDTVERDGSLYVSLWDKVTYHHGSIAVGHGVSFHEIAFLTREQINDLHLLIAEYFFNNLHNHYKK